MQELERCFVQFIHPGPEHGDDGNGRKAWSNARLHRRKFLHSPGTYIEEIGRPTRDADLVFWGEWEPESDVERLAWRVQGGPHWLHKPYYVQPPAYVRDGQGLQNSDPFVFGDRFLYTLCKQVKKQGQGASKIWRPTLLRDLAPGSLVLFGSLKASEFVLDTVFVVGQRESVLHSPASWPTLLREGRITQTYADVTMRAGCDWDCGVALRLYEGATPDSPVNGMFSFVPCVPASGEEAGFPRPAIRLNNEGDEYITPTLPIGLKSKRNVALDTLTTLWRDVVTQVTERGLALGTRFDLPPRREA